MDTAKQHWKILLRVPDDLARKVRKFMVIGWKGEGVMLLTDNGEGYWLGNMRFISFGISELNGAFKPTKLDVPKLASMAHGDSHILLLTESGQIHAMGFNDVGQFGLGTEDEEIYFSPQLISIPHKFISVKCGKGHSVALTEDGKVWAWGLNDCGQVGMPSSTDFFPSPRQISELDSYRVVAVECGSDHLLALTDQGEVYAWGWNDWGQLGDGSEESTHTPTRISSSSLFKSIAAGRNHTLLLTRSGEVWTCGWNGCSQLGLPTSTESSSSLVKVSGLPPISQIESHYHFSLSVAMSAERECFVWGDLGYTTSSNPIQLPSIYSTFDSVLSLQSTQHMRNIPCSVRVKGQRTDLLTGSTRMGDRIARMFDNPKSNPDVKFKLGDKSILAHRCLLQISSTYFARFFSEPSSSADLNPPTSIFGSKRPRLTTNPSVPDPQINPISPLTTIPIADHCYPTFHAYLRFLYTGTLQVPTEHLADLFELAHSHLESDLSELCLVRMRSTLSPENCCLFYQLTERHSLPEFQQELIHFIADNLLQVFTTEAYQSMDEGLFKKLTIFVVNLHSRLTK